jgi:diguanylate cyclase (GGDEF)-like protein
LYTGLIILFLVLATTSAIGLVVAFKQRKRVKVSSTPIPEQGAVVRAAVEPAAKKANETRTELELEAIDRSKMLIHGLMMGVSNNIESFVGEVTEYRDALDGYTANIKKAMTLAALQEVERLLVTEVESMRGVTENHRQQLAKAQETINAQQEEIERLSEDATIDFVTKVANRRALNQRLAEETARFKRNGPVFSVIMMDIDLFKQVNDTYGHIAGDRILRAVATLIQEHKREADYLGRYGGEEFCLILPNSELLAAEAVAEKIRKRIEATRFNYEGKTIPVTLSAGVAEIGARNDIASELIKRADSALYRAKANGRNRVEAAGIAPTSSRP